LLSFAFPLVEVLATRTLTSCLPFGFCSFSFTPADITLISTGSEVAIVVEAVETLAKQGVKARVVSLPCWEVFEEQPVAYKLQVIPSGAPVLSVEAYNTFGEFISLSEQKETREERERRASDGRTNSN